jgi:hypothetical protein
MPTESRFMLCAVLAPAVFRKMNPEQLLPGYSSIVVVSNVVPYSVSDFTCPWSPRSLRLTQTPFEVTSRVRVPV